MNIFKLTGTAFLLSVTAVIMGCNLEDNGPAIPENAITLDSSNAKPTFDEAISALDILFSNNIQASTSNKSILNQIRENRKNSGQDIVARATFNNNILCITGSATEIGSEKGDGKGNGSGSGELTFYNCELISGIVINGTITFEYNWQSDGDWDENFGGNISITETANNITTQLSSIHVAEKGNTPDKSYAITAYQFTYDPGSEGFAVQVGTTITGNTIDCGPISGAIMINGSSGTRIRATFNNDTSLKIELSTGNGIFTEIASSPFSCII